MQETICVPDRLLIDNGLNRRKYDGYVNQGSAAFRGKRVLPYGIMKEEKCRLCGWLRGNALSFAKAADPIGADVL